MKEWKRAIYIVSMAIVMITAGVFLTQFSYAGENGTLFRFNAFGINANVTMHFLINIVIICALFMLYMTSCRNYLLVVDVKHTTTISRK